MINFVINSLLFVMTNNDQFCDQLLYKNVFDGRIERFIGSKRRVMKERDTNWLMVLIDTRMLLIDMRACGQSRFDRIKICVRDAQTFLLLCHNSYTANDTCTKRNC